MSELYGMNVQKITVGELFEARKDEWDMEILAGHEGLDREIATFELNRPGLALAGYVGVFSSDRVQMIGLTETSFLNSLPAEERYRCLHATFEFSVPCIVITRELEAVPEMLRISEELKLPLLRTKHPTTPFQAELGQFLERRLAPRTPVHGVMMEVFGMGVLIQGKSGVGKSECSLELIERGHLLVADDIVMVRRVARGRLFGEASPTLGSHMEIRGIGIIDVERLFGIRSVRAESEMALIVQLERWDSEKEYERLGLEDQIVTLFDCQLPQVVLPVEPGRNIAQLVEIAALTQRLKTQGVNLAEDFEKRIQRVIERKSGFHDAAGE